MSKGAAFIQTLMAISLCTLVGGIFGALTTASPGAALATAGLLLSFTLASFTGSFMSARSLLYVVIVSTIFTSTLARGVALPFLALNELVLIVGLALAFFFALMNRLDKPFPGPLLAAVGILMVGTIIAPVLSYPVRGTTLSASDVVGLLAPLQYLGLLWLFATIPRRSVDRRMVVHLLILCASAVALIGILQAAQVPPVVAWLETWYPSGQLARTAELSRVTSVLGAWNALGLFSVVNLFLVAATYPYEHRRLYRLNMQVAMVLLLLCLLATNLYSGFLALLLGLAMLRLLDPNVLERRALIAGVGAVAVGVALLLPGLIERFAFQAGSETFLFQTLGFRVNVWLTYFLPAIQENLWWGASPSFATLGFEFPESQYIYLLVKSGLVSLLAHLVWLAVLIGWLGRVYRRVQLPFDRALVAVAVTQLITFSVVGIINPVFTYSGSIDILWILLGLVASTERV